MKNILLIALTWLAVSSAAFGQTKLTENTLKLEKREKGASAQVSEMSWMEGTWTGKALGGKVKEVWTKTDAGGMIGMFALTKTNKPVFYEFLTFTVENGELLLKLKHFNPDMVSWEEKDKTTNFRFIKREGERFYFHGLTFEKAGRKRLNIYLALRDKNKKLREESFKMRRIKK